ncbi:MAG TPA: hypothetical protein DIW44_07560 [Anaerolineaceae bacterium]|nr:hypothetical protein [Anaerolineaceae bacterium]
MPLPSHRKKIINLFSKIENDSLRTIISEVISLENEQRSSPNFPIRKVEAIVDGEASLLELRESKRRDNEIR